MQKRYKTIQIEEDLECECGGCEADVIYLVIDENKTLATLASEDDVLCECFSESNAEMIVNALNRLATN
ncbi:hypothetical protein [Rhizobium azibense]|uniref:Uncharacterized protein n=1 Tax=Rhizobium azibense TaxID=1136135 RepID=A0A4R3RHY3_9HYPH|nr:hypothetical protein [Rhizobium azibense]TCU34037.1 hypothetical protein EV129_11320 [Rhizobium azibense]